MDQGDKAQPVNNSEDISIAELVDKIKSGIKYIKTKWISILIVSLLGAILGLCYSVLKKPTYTAVCTFVLEDAKTGGLGQYAGLASLAGINLGGSGSSIFQGDNILELYKSRSMIEKTLLSAGNFNGKKQLLIDRFADSYKLRSKWKSDTEIGNVEFKGNPDNFNRKQDSLITDITEFINKKILNVGKPDKKLSIIDVAVETKDELFSKFFTEKLVQNVNDFYVQTKTKKSAQNVQILQHQVDSVRAILNYSINGVASANDAAPNANPAMSTLRVASQRKQIDVQANSAIYSEIVKNLELAKISLRQETPLIQIIDKPVLPLTETKVGKIKGAFIGFAAGLLIAVAFFIIKNMFAAFIEPT